MIKGIEGLLVISLLAISSGQPDEGRMSCCFYPDPLPKERSCIKDEKLQSQSVFHSGLTETFSSERADFSIFLCMEFYFHSASTMTVNYNEISAKKISEKATRRELN